MTTIDLVNGTLTRIGYVDVPIPPEAAGLTADDIESVSWSRPTWATDDQLLAGAAIWIADVDGTRVAFDPMLAADDVLRADGDTERAQQTAVAGVLEAAGYPRESVDMLALSHVDGIGMAGWRDEHGEWSAFFPNARILMSAAEVRLFESLDPDDTPASSGIRALLDQGSIDTFEDGAEIGPGIHAAVDATHGPGHAVFDLARADGGTATIIGHLAVSPLHVATGVCEGLHVDAVSAYSVLETLAADGRTLIGPLWPEPACGRLANGEFVAG